MKLRAFVVAGASLAVLGCGESSPAQATNSSGPPPMIVSGAPLSSAAVADELSTKPLELLKFRFTSGVNNKEPIDRLDHATPGKRVYAHLSVRNRTGRARKVTLAFAVNGKEASKVELTVDESWEWRTWAYNTLAASDTKGTLSLSIIDDEGHPLADESLPIRSR